MWGIAYVAALLLSLPPVDRTAWHAVVVDVSEHGRFVEPHSCAAVVGAWTRIRSVSFPDSAIPDAIRREARRACRRGRPSLIRTGMSDAAVVAVAGMPQLPLSGPHCWVYPARRVCFTGGRVSAVQVVAHG
jgi:hypothetical protein